MRRSYLQRYAGKLFSTPANDIDTTAIIQVLEPIWERIPPTAWKIRADFAEILDMARAYGFRDGPNPAAWKDHLKHLLPVITHTATPLAMLEYRQLPAFMAKLHGWDDDPSHHPDSRGRVDYIGCRVPLTPAVEFMIYTTTRPSETAGAEWEEIDEANRIWHIPAKRMKKRRPHDVPLCDQAMQILDEMRQRARTPKVLRTALGKRILAALQTEPHVTNHRGATTPIWHTTYRGPHCQLWQVRDGLPTIVRKVDIYRRIAAQIGCSLETMWYVDRALRAHPPLSTVEPKYIFEGVYDNRQSRSRRWWTRRSPSLSGASLPCGFAFPCGLKPLQLVKRLVEAPFYRRLVTRQNGTRRRRRRRQAHDTIRSAKRSSSSPIGANWARRRFPNSTSSASHSPGTSASRDKSPCFRPFSATAALPAGVRGPVLFFAFRRLASIRRSLVISECSLAIRPRAHLLNPL
jgi:integrase